MTIYIVRRDTAKGPRYYVRFEAGVKERSKIKRPDGEKPDRWPTVHLGTFASKKLADARVKAAHDEIANGRMPQRWQDTPSTIDRSIAEWAALWIASRRGLAESTRLAYARVIRTLPDEIASADPSAITYTDVQDFIAALERRPHRKRGSKAEGLKRGSINRELVVLKLVLDYAGVTHNPARDRRVELPRKQRATYRLPTRAELADIHAALPTRSELMTLLENSGLRISEAAALRWRDVDRERGRLLVGDSKTNAGVRWVEHLPGTPDFPNRDESARIEDLVFAKPSPLTLTNVLAQSHRRNGTANITSHSMRHLHASRLLHEQILSPAQIAARLGHANVSVTLGTYSHCLPPD